MMNKKTALGIVLELAEQNVLEDKYVDSEALKECQSEQNEALKVVRSLLDDTQE